LNGNGAMDLVGTTLNTSFTHFTTFDKRHHSPPYNILVPLHGDYIQMSFFSGLSNGSPKIGILVVSKLGLLLVQNFGCAFFSNQVFYEIVRKISYSP
jgi:hypothetical protein